MQIEEDLIESVLDMLLSKDADNHAVVAAILEITAEDLTEQAITANVDKILALTNHIIAEKKRKENPAYPATYNVRFIAEQVYDKLVFGTIRRATHVQQNDPFVLFSKISYETEFYNSVNKKI